MTGQQDNPEDLIAELTKLMALEARPSVERDKPAPIPAAPPVAAIQQRPAPPTIRIPGVDQPVRTAPNANAGQPPKAEPGNPAGESVVPWPRPAAAPAANDGHAASAPVPGQAGSRPALSAVPAPAAPETIPSFEFDFGFNRQRPEALPREAIPLSPAKPAAATAPAAIPSVRPPDHDPIAELIAAELKGVISQPAPAPVPAIAVKPEPLPEKPAEARSAVPAPQPAIAPPTAEAARLAPQSSTPQPAASQSAAPQAGPPAATQPAPRPAAESDRFATAPVFGVGNRPVGEALAAKPKLDPIDEIESLIGEAVRVELSGRPQPAATPAAPVQKPVVPPLATNFGPRRTPSLRESETSGGADETILAATAAGNADIGRIDTPFAEERPAAAARKPQRRERERFESEEPRSAGAIRQFVVPIIAGVVLVAIGFGLYWGLGMGHHDGAAPVLTADATPAKTVPPKPADTTPHSVVMDELSGSTPKPTTETLVSRDQTQGTDGTTQVAAPAATTTAAADEASLANRKVRTVTVRPDGTIISGDDGVAGGTQLPVQRPNVPAVPGISVANANEPAPAATPPANGMSAGSAITAPVIDTSGVPSDDPIAQAIAASAPGVSTGGSAAPAPADATAPAADVTPPVPMPRSMRPEEVATTDDSAVTSPKPASAVNAVVGNNSAARPLDLVGSTPRTVARKAPEPAASVEPAAAAGSAAAHVQLASQPSEAAAQATANSLQKRFGNLFNGAKLSVVRADLGSKGVYYRVVMPTSSLSDAQQLCSSIKSGGGDCVASNG